MQAHPLPASLAHIANSTHKRPLCGHCAPVLAVNPANHAAPAACALGDLHSKRVASISFGQHISSHDVCGLLLFWSTMDGPPHRSRHCATPCKPSSRERNAGRAASVGQRTQRFAYSEARRAVIPSTIFIADESEPRSESSGARRPSPAANLRVYRTPHSISRHACAHANHAAPCGLRDCPLRTDWLLLSAGRLRD